jgi:hypothetical protein
MAIYQLDEETLVDSNRAVEEWKQDYVFEGTNLVSRATGSQWRDETLYKSAQGRYWVEHYPRIDREIPYAYELSKREAARWILLNGGELPIDLQEYELEVIQ